MDVAVAVKPVRKASLTPVADAIGRARKTIGAMQCASSFQVDGPTPERAAQAGRKLVIGAAVRSVEIVRAGQPQTEQVRVPRARVDEDPFTMMVQRGKLDPESEDVNRWLGEAGSRYRRLREKAGRAGLQGQDPTKGFTTASRGQSDVLDRMLDAWSEWDAARTAIPEQFRRTVDDILLEGMKPEEAHLPAGSYSNAKYRMVIAMTLLRLGLQALDGHFAAVDAGRE